MRAEEVLRRVRSSLWQPEAPSAEMNRKRWGNVTRIVDEALKRSDPRERIRYLDEACRGERELRREVETLLGFADSKVDILTKPLLRRLDRQSSSSSPLLQAVSERDGRFVPRAGERIGRYEVERVLGEGGMGVVVLASDPELDRQVALKLSREKTTPEQQRRFEREGRLLAKLKHPSIVSILDYGEANDRSYFTMEHVDGEPIDAWCDHARKSVEERLELVIKVCEGLEVAHNHFVVHRDLKPSNLLVDSTGAVRILDFGIAKAVSPESELSAPLDDVGRQPLTLAYASPEQVSGGVITTASDVYSLGVVIYELLCGHPPRILDGDVEENIRRICDEEPPLASSRTMVAREVWREGHPTLISSHEIASHRSSTPQRLRRRLTGDLDSILAKALASDPDLRYSSMRQLSEDLERHREGLRIRARPDTPMYRVEKFLTRYRQRLLIVGSLIMVFLSLIMVFGSLYSESEDRARTAEWVPTSLGQFTHDLLWRLIRDHPNVDEGLKEAEALVHGAVLDDEHEMLPIALESLGRVYQKLHRHEKARELLEESLDELNDLYTDDHSLKARSLNNLGALEFDAGNLDTAEDLYRQALDMRRRLGQSGEDTANVESNLASILLHRGEFAEAEERYRRILKVHASNYGLEHETTATAFRNLGNLLYLKGEFTAAETSLRKALKTRREVYERRSLKVAAVLGNLGRVLHARGLSEELDKKELLDEAEEVYREALSIREEQLGDDHLHVALARKDLAMMLFDVGNDADRIMAEFLWHRAIEVLWKEKGPKDLESSKELASWEIADVESHLGARLAAEGRVEEAEICLVRSYETLRRLRGEEAIMTRRALDRLEAFRDMEARPPHLQVQQDLQRIYPTRAAGF